MSDIYDDASAQSEDSLKGRFLTFSILGETYGLEIRYVTQIVGIQAITQVPETPCFIKGIINLRGRIVPMIDMRLRFGKPEREYDDRTCIIVIDFNGKSVGLIVDRVSEVMTIRDEDMDAVPISSGGGFIKAIGKVGAGVVMLIDCQKLLSEEALLNMVTQNQ
jgi:purine-binding chemotaxis protein CheW